MSEKDEALQALTDMRLRRLVVEAEELEAVRRARATGASWQDITEALGYTAKSFIWKKYHGRVP